MKLRSIVTAGLLATGLLTMSGCDWFEDKVDEAIEASLPNVIHLANGHTGYVQFTINDDLHDVEGFTSEMAMPIWDGTFTVNNGYSGQTEEFKAGSSAHLYALCQEYNIDTGNTVLTDSATPGARDIEILNLSAHTIDAADYDPEAEYIVVKLFNVNNVELSMASSKSTTLAGCSKETLTFDPAFNLSDVAMVQVNDRNHTIPPYDDDIKPKLDSLNSVDFDIVIFNPLEGDENGTIIPLATASDLF